MHVGSALMSVCRVICTPHLHSNLTTPQRIIVIPRGSKKTHTAERIAGIHDMMSRLLLLIAREGHQLQIEANADRSHLPSTPPML